MPDMEAPEADVIEQELPPPGQPAGEAVPTEVGVDVPEADALEQAADDEAQPRRRLEIPDDVPEADALEQSHVVELDEESYRG